MPSDSILPPQDTGPETAGAAGPDVTVAATWGGWQHPGCAGHPAAWRSAGAKTWGAKFGLRQDWLEEVGRRILSFFLVTVWFCKIRWKGRPRHYKHWSWKGHRLHNSKEFCMYQQCYNQESMVSGSCETSIPVVVWMQTRGVVENGSASIWLMKQLKMGQMVVKW